MTTTSSAPVSAPKRRSARFMGRDAGREPVRLALLGKRLRSFVVVGMTPHRNQVLRALATRVAETDLERTPERALRRGHRRGRVARDRLGKRLGLLAQPFGRADDLADHAQ